MTNRYTIDSKTGCWNWLLSRDRRGYGKIGNRGAHRVIYEKIVGQVPVGMQLDHLCRNRACVNPNHLEPVTNAENSRRGARAQITMDDANLIRILWRGTRMTQATIAQVFGIKQWNVNRIVHNTRWI